MAVRGLPYIGEVVNRCVRKAFLSHPNGCGTNAERVAPTVMPQVGGLAKAVEIVRGMFVRVCKRSNGSKCRGKVLEEKDNCRACSRWSFGRE